MTMKNTACFADLAEMWFCKKKISRVKLHTRCKDNCLITKNSMQHTLTRLS